jgi:hypothetical protein
MASLSTYLEDVIPPNPYSAVHYPIIYSGTPYKQVVFIDNNAGKLRLTFATLPTITLNVDELIYIETGPYIGFHFIESIASGVFVTTKTAFASADITPRLVKYCPVLKFDIYKGFKTGEQYPTELPYTKIAEITAEVNVNTRYYTWDVSGFLKSIFLIKPPVVGIDFNLFNAYRLVYGSQELEVYRVANAAIPQTDFTTNYVNTGAWLNSQDVIIFNCGKTIYSKLQSNVVINEVIEDNTFLPDFTPLQFTNEFKITVP